MLYYQNNGEGSNDFASHIYVYNDKLNNYSSDWPTTPATDISYDNNFYRQTVNYNC